MEYKIGSKIIHTNGYVRIKLNNKKWVYEHIYIAEKMVGRKLKNNECVHHIDKDKTNNNPDNILIARNQKHHFSYHLQLRDKICVQCGKLFHPIDRKVKRCSTKCRADFLRGKPFSGKAGHPKGGYRN